MFKIKTQNEIGARCGLVVSMEKNRQDTPLAAAAKNVSRVRFRHGTNIYPAYRFWLFVYVSLNVIKVIHDIKETPSMGNVVSYLMEV